MSELQRVERINAGKEIDLKGMTMDFGQEGEYTCLMC